MFNQLKILALEERIVFDAAAATVIYVNASAAPGGDGTSWSQAYNNLDSALATAAATAGADQIWIAEGVYRPSQIYAPNGVTGGASGLNDSHLKTFNLPTNVQLYGGFNGNETLLSHRNPIFNPTILSGDLLGNDLNNPNHAGYLASKADNVWHVLTAGNDIAKTGVTATLDGLIVKNGFAAGPNQVLAGTVVFAHESGAGLYARFGSQITINEVAFSENIAGMGTLPRATVAGGGGVFGDGTGTLFSISHSVFSDNFSGLQNIQPPHASVEGGGLSIVRGASADIDHTLFKSNGAVDRGGAINAVTGALGHLNIEDSILMDNQLFGGNQGGITHFSVGAGIRAAQTPLFVSDTLFLHNHGVRDMTTGTGGTIGGAMLIEPGNSPTTIEHSAFIGNEAFLGGAIFMDGGLATINMPDNLFVNNSAVMGGAIFKEGLILNITDSTFISNSAESGGGAIATDFTVFDLLAPNQGPNLPLNISNSQFISNSSDGVLPTAVETFSRLYLRSLTGVAETFYFTAGGGAILNIGDAKTVITDSQFVNNNAYNSSGGAIFNGGAKYTRDANPTLERNTGGTVMVTNSTFTNNGTDGNGGVIASQLHASVVVPANLPILSLTNSILKNNDADHAGGVLYFDRTVATINANTFYKSNDARLADQIYGTNSTVNSITTATPAAVVANLQATNSFQNLKPLEDLYFA